MTSDGPARCMQVGLAAARDGWRADQFLMLFVDDARAMRGPALVARLAAFTGLTAPRRPVGPKCDAAAACAAIVHNQRCHAAHHGAQPGAQHGAAARLLGNASLARLRRFFAPSLEALLALLEGTFEPAAAETRLRAMRAAYLRGIS